MKADNKLPCLILVILVYVNFGCKTRDEGEMSKITEFQPGHYSVKIGNQDWMTKNLDVDTFRNGDSIPEINSLEEWIKVGEEGKPAWCYYAFDINNGKKYGKLYNWYAVNDPRQLAPINWHIPNQADWVILIKELGGKHEDLLSSPQSHSASLVGRKLQSKAGWGDSSIGTDESGFSGLPGGYKTAHDFNGIHSASMWWSSSQGLVLGLYNDGILWLGGNPYTYYDLARSGCSVRCLKD